MPGRAKEVHPKGDGFNELWIQRVGVQFSDPAFNVGGLWVESIRIADERYRWLVR